MKIKIKEMDWITTLELCEDGSVWLHQENKSLDDIRTTLLTPKEIKAIKELKKQEKEK